MKKILLTVILFGSLSAFTSHSENSANENNAFFVNDAIVKAYKITNGTNDAYFYTLACANTFIAANPGYYHDGKVDVDESMIIICYP